MADNFFFFYLESKIEVGAEQLTGAQIKEAIKAKVPDLDTTHELVLEGDPDKVVSDDEPVDLSRHHGGPKRFFSRPPTNFGA
jgi:hypothetical protein